MDIFLSSLLFLALLFFFTLSFFISGAEVSLFSLDEKELNEMQQENKQTKYLKNISRLRDLLLATILLINNFANIAIVVISAYISQHIFGIPSDSWTGTLINVFLITILILIFGEIIPKAYAQVFFKKFGLWVAGPLYFAQKTLYPFSWLLYKLSDSLLHKKSIPVASINREAFDDIIDFTKNSKEISDEEKKMLENIQRIIDVDSHKIMTPKVDIFAVSKNTSFGDLLNLITSHSFSRIPIYKDSVDNIQGILYVKDLLLYSTQKNMKWERLVKQVVCIPGKKKLVHLLQDFLEKKNHMAIVVDEFGQTEGLITLEDVVEEIVGDIRDEFDTETLPYSTLDKNTFIFDGKTSLIDFCRLMNLNSDFFDQHNDRIETLAGLMLELSSNMPTENQTYLFNHLTLSVEAKEEHRIEKIRVVKNQEH